MNLEQLFRKELEIECKVNKELSRLVQNYQHNEEESEHVIMGDVVESQKTNYFCSNLTKTRQTFCELERHDHCCSHLLEPRQREAIRRIIEKYQKVHHLLTHMKTIKPKKECVVKRDDNNNSGPTKIILNTISIHAWQMII